MQLLDVQMSVSDPWQAASFYEQILDLPVVRREGSVQVSVGSSTLTLRPGGESGGGSHHLALTVPASQFDQAKRRLSDRTPLLRRDGADEFTLPAPWRSRSIYFSGPDATLLELIARRDLPEPTPRDSPRGPLCVSEVGVAVDDADTVAGDLHATFGLGRFDAGGPGFVPVGDHHGLLIVVARRRPWFPTVDLVPSEAPLIISLDAGSRPSGRSLVVGACTLRSTNGRPPANRDLGS